MNKRILLFACIFLFTGCTQNVDNASIGRQTILENIDDVNQSITIETYNLSIGHTIDIGIVNNSDSSIWFPRDWNIKLYVNQNGEFLEIGNRATYLDTSEIILEPFNNLGDIAIITIAPDITFQAGVSIRVVIIGNIYKNGHPTEKLVATYIDIDLSP